MKDVAVFDIDGCVIDSSTRVVDYFAGRYDSYKARYLEDCVIDQGYLIYKMFLSDPNFTCVFITSRREDQRELTMHQLTLVFGSLMDRALLLMRPKGCDKEQMSDADLKPWLLSVAEIDISRVFIAFDDRQSVVDEWRARGVVCYQPDVDETLRPNYNPNQHSVIERPVRKPLSSFINDSMEHMINNQQQTTVPLTGT